MRPTVRIVSKKQAEIRLYGWEFLHTISMVVCDDDQFVRLFGIQVGPASFYWTNPFAGED
jgi:hypothetical protein